ncbi:MAG: hypothetical protein EA362_08415 [Saprospirales bacterium]|nr:MAG: hypothetical protein EA362_08415 [Saprospirales bacterium]
MIRVCTLPFILSFIILPFFMAKVDAQIHLENEGGSYYYEMTSEHARLFIHDLSEDCFTIRICNLEVGQEYFLTSGLTQSRKILELVQAKDSEWSMEGRILNIEPQSDCIELSFCTDRKMPNQSPFLSISKSIEEKAITAAAARNEGIRIVADNDAEALIKDVLVGGNCFDISNVRGIGPSLGLGRFHNGGSSINIENGIVLSTGNVENIVGPNSSHRTGTIMHGDGDSDLELLVNGEIVNDAVGIQFDFVPTSDTVRFRYVFASEEYCEWLYENFNDVFGFFISGPGISGPFSNNAINIATIPGTEDFVAIQNINHNINQHLFFDNTPQGQEQGAGSVSSCGSLLDQDGVAVELIEFDGFTAVFEATAVVTPCETYTIKMVIGDVLDYNYDSAVFLEANSFNAGASAQMESRVSGFTDQLIFDECLADMGYFVVSRLGSSDLSETLEVNLNYSHLSTAIPGLDFEALPSTIVIPAGEDSVLVPLRILDTYSGERLSIVYELEDLCSCTSPFAEIIIDFNPNQPKADITVDGLLTCENHSVELTGEILTPELVTHYKWLDGDGEVIIEDVLNISARNVGDYALVVLNENSSCTDTIMVTVKADTEIPEIEIETPDILNCINETINLNASSSMSGQDISFYWETQGEGVLIGEADTSHVIAGSSGTYLLTVKNNISGCVSTSTIEVFSDFELPQAELETPKELNCEIREATINVVSDFSFDKFDFNWSSSSGSIDSDPTNGSIVVSEAGIYELELRLRRNGCSIILSSEVMEDITKPTVSLGEDLIFPCTLETMLLKAKTNFDGLDVEFHWSGSAEIHEIAPNEVSIRDEGIYSIRIIDLNNGCWGQDEIIVSRNLPVSIEMDVFQPICPDDRGVLSVLSVEGGTYPYSYLLKSGNNQHLESNGFFNQLQPDDYQIEVIDALGCSFKTGFKILEPHELKVNLPERDIAKLGQKYQMPLELNVSDSDISYVFWTGESEIDCPNCLRPSVNLLRPTLFEVYLEDDRGCYAKGEIYLDLDKRPAVFVPNAFSPNNDGVNDFFTIYSDSSIKRVVELSIYNRWGKRYYQRLDFNPNADQLGWDGSDFRGQKADPGVYIYIAVVELINGDIIELSGEVQLFR